MCSMTSEGHAYARFQRALDRRNVAAAEDAARELPHLSLDDALQLVRLYGERGSPKYERAALRWLERYVAESRPSLCDLAQMSALLVEHVP
jgi:hypothetical protein